MKKQQEQVVANINDILDQIESCSKELRRLDREKEEYRSQIQDGKCSMPTLISIKLLEKRYKELLERTEKLKAQAKTLRDGGIINE